MRIVDPEDAYTQRNPVFNDAQHLDADAFRVVVKVDRVDVLILLRWVLGEGDRAVGQGGEPLGVGADPRMVGRALQGQVECHLEAELAGSRDEVGKALDVPQIGVDRVVTTGSRTDRPRGSGVVRAGIQKVVWPLSIAASDRMNRRQVHHVESHGRDLGQPPCSSAECTRGPRAVLVALGSLASGEELVPAAHGRPGALDAQQ